MENESNKVEEGFVQSFKQLESLNNLCSVKQNVVWEHNREYLFFDLIIEYAGVPYAVIEIKHSTKSSSYQIKEDISKAMRILSCPFGILINGEKSYLYSTKQNEPIFDGNFDDLLVVIKAQIEKKKFNIVDNPVVKVIISQKLHINRELPLYDKGETLGFSEDDEIFLWEQIIGTSPKKPLCRYTSLESVVKMLTNGTIRMNGLAAMNDTTETSLYEHIVHHKRNAQIPNNIFISSCSTKEDDLTMWRLYGDDGKGACLVFELDTEPESDFIISPICYVNSDVKKTLKAIGELIRQNVKLTYENINSHCLKPIAYKEENEVRILYNSSANKSIETNWSVSPDYSIVNPYIEVRLDVNTQKNLKLKKIILGPTCPNRKLNKNQISRLLKETEVYHENNAVCELSKINCYR